MQNIIKNFLDEYNIKGEKILIGFSGGIDSTVLTHLLNSVKNEFDLDITCIHLNHNFRGEESDLDEKAAKNFTKKLNLDFYSEKLPDIKSKTETIARDLRYEFFYKMAKKYKTGKIFLAHNKDDNIETLIFRIIKGTGIDGLCSIQKKRDIFYRPMLDISRDEIEKYADENNLEFCFDKTNDDIKYKRNLIRHKILPLFLEVNETAKLSINNLIKVANLEHEIICDKIKEIEDEIFENNKIKSDEFQKLKRYYKIKIIQKYIKDDLKNPRLDKIEQIVDFIDETTSEIQDPQFRKYKKFSINKDLFLYVNKKEIFKGK